MAEEQDTKNSGKLPYKIKEEFINARKYREGRTIQIEIKSKADLENILQLIKIKLDG